MNTRPDLRDPQRRHKMFKERPIQGGDLSKRSLQEPHDMTKSFFDRRKAERRRLRPG